MKYFATRILLLAVTTILISLSGCQKEQQKETQSNNQESLDSLFEAYHQFKLRINPIEGTKAGMTEYNHKLSNFISDEFQSDLKIQYNNFLEAIKNIDQSKLDESQLISLKVMRWDCEIKKEGLNNALVSIPSPMFDLPNLELFPINQIFSFHLYFATFADVGGAQPFKTVKDYENWLSRIDDYLTWIETARSKMEEGIERDVVLPKAIIKKIIGQLGQFTNSDIENHLFYAAANKMPEEFSAEESERLKKAFRTKIENKFIPTFINLEQFLTDVYLSAGVEASGIGALPNGPETYQYLIKYHTSTNMTPDEIFNLGQSEVERISSEMEKIKGQVGFKGDLKAFFVQVRNSKEQKPFTEPEQVIDNFNAIHAKMKGNLNNLFDLTPKARFEVRRTQAFRESSASAEYDVGSKDGLRPGIFYVPIPNVTEYNKFSDEALFLHEAIPGHHYQLSLQQENENLPGFLHSEGMGVYVEGWALYAESLGKELGLYEDPYQYFGMLSMEMHRAIRLVVDAGIHAKGWSREKAIQYSLDHEAESEDAITSEIERYMVAPGQALAYKVGQLKIRELRTRAENALGDKFNIKEFHNQVLNSGSLPLVLLEEKIDRWIAN